MSRFRVIVYAHDAEPIEETVVETVVETSALVRSYIEDNPHITREESVKKIQRSVRGIEYQLLFNPFLWIKYG
ncbi:hypothetical protein FAZ15_07415 [Sphingobacterium olei]|uniref:Uncharacterized protein n=1 Tax=Sphingobacterium olei TaxID=2571155 RepID=A0A4U0P4K8_9SPHI|nr:hypothetical protein [Sphingobacterium olei]TJZ62326.1 hypothetical protein FAZ15_07415 [Sphingobacterium olei]